MTKDEAIQHFGGAPALAKALGIERQAVYQWDKVPEKQQLRLEKITAGALVADPTPEKTADPKPKTEAA
jgi:hypothetical protein